MVLHGLNMLIYHENILYVEGYNLVKFQSNLDEKREDIVKLDQRSKS